MQTKCESATLLNVASNAITYSSVAFKTFKTYKNNQKEALITFTLQGSSAMKCDVSLNFRKAFVPYSRKYIFDPICKYSQIMLFHGVIYSGVAVNLVAQLAEHWPSKLYIHTGR